MSELVTPMTADDLTGASDVATAFVAGGAPARVLPYASGWKTAPRRSRETGALVLDLYEKAAIAGDLVVQRAVSAVASLLGNRRPVCLGEVVQAIHHSQTCRFSDPLRDGRLQVREPRRETK